MTVFVRRSKQKTGKVPSWLGGRMSLSSNMSELLRKKFREAAEGNSDSEELISIQPILDVQRERSLIPNEEQFLIEKSWSKEGCHCFFFPFEGRYVHEGLSALIAHRISQLTPITFSIAMNDYGFELLSDQDIPINKALENNLFSQENLISDILSSLNDTELAKRKFRGISQIAGLVFSGFPGNKKAGKHLQMSSSLFFDVFSEYEPDHLLLQQAYDEVLDQQLDESRLRRALERINQQEIIVKEVDRFSPLAFPIFVDRLRERLSSEKLLDRIMKMQKELEKD
jgi:ATP-dependent Lhr-like helicase